MQLPLFEEVIEPDHDALARCLKASAVAVDIETETRWSGVGPRLDFGLSYSAPITVIALAWQEKNKNSNDTADDTDYTVVTTAIAAPFQESIGEFLRQLFRESRWIIAHNAVFDLRQLSKLTGGLIPERIWDTQSMARLLHPAVGASYSLLSVASALSIPFSDEQQQMKAQRGKLHKLPLELTLTYAQQDAEVAFRIFQKQRAMPSDVDLVDWEIRATYAYCSMSARGIKLNTPFVERRVAELTTQRNLLADRLREDGLTNPSSNRARAIYLYQQKGIPIPVWAPDSRHFTRAGHRRLREQPGTPVQLSDLSTQSSVVESYCEEGSPYYSERLHDLADYMAVDWLISTLNGLTDHAASDGRLHSLVTTATESGRRASSFPHMQNWKMPEMAGVAIGDEGFTLVEIDYRNAESVMSAFIAEDSALAAACMAEDFHSSMASQYFPTAWASADLPERKRLRNMAKKITFGTAYGMGAERLGESIGVSTEEAERVIREKDRKFINVTRSRNLAKQRTREGGILELWTGRKVAVPTSFVAWNYLCQGGVSEVLKRAIVLISEAFSKRKMRSWVALDMHDAIILEIAHEEWELALALACQMMCSITPEFLNNRTDPPIRWVAKPDLRENRLKWGAEQWHPELE